MAIRIGGPSAPRAAWARIGLAILLVLSLPPAAPGAAPAPWGWLGIRIRDLSEQEMDEISQRHGLREGFGAVIVEVLNDTPAAASGLRTGDIVVAFRDRPIVDTRALQRSIASASIGETVLLTVLRKDEGRRPVSVRIGAMPEPVLAERVAAEYGFFVRDPEPQPEIGGSVPAAVAPSVAGIVPRSRAEAAGLRVGDVVVEVNGQPIGTVAALRDALAAVSPDGPLALVVRRDRERLSVSLDPIHTR
jgi:serine protease Do